MLKRTFAGVLSLIFPGTTLAATSACTAGARLHYPVSQVLLVEASILDLSHYRHPDWKRGEGNAYRAVVEAALAPLGALEADIRLLALLEKAGGQMGHVMPSLTTLSPSVMFDRFLDVLDRRDLPVQARAMRAARDAFSTWEGTPESRRLQLITKDGMIADPLLLANLDEQTTVWRAARPQVIDRAVALLAEDPTLAARYEAARQAASDEARLGWLIQQIHACADQDWLTPGEADRAFAKLPPAQRDLMLLHIFTAEVLNGGGIQLFHNSSGTLVPDMQAAFARHGLDEHAAALVRGMAEFPVPYPRATRARREAMADFSQPQMDSIDAMMDLATDPAVQALMVRIAKEAGIWPS
jgi:hypothetical protein